MAVVKADAYGHGMAAVVPQLLSLGVRSFAAATLDEGSQLRALGAEGTVLILGCTSPQRAGELARLGLTQTVADLAHAEALNAQGVPLRVHLTQFTSCWLSSSWRLTRRVIRTFWEFVWMTMPACTSLSHAATSVSCPSTSTMQMRQAPISLRSLR